MLVQAAIPQEERPILLIVLNEGAILDTSVHWFFPKPDDLTYTRPVRATVSQTLGGAYVDDFGEGVCEIACNGRSSYRFGPAGSSLTLRKHKVPCDEFKNHLGMGELMLKNLKDWLTRDFHINREKNAKMGLDPDLYQMYFADVLNAELWTVFPIHAVFRRHKQSPLLIQYSMRFIGLQRVI